MNFQPRASTALLLIDPYNDFLSEGGKLWPRVREMATRLELLPHLRHLLATARQASLPVFFVPHHRGCPGDFAGWKFMNPTHRAVQALELFARGSWGAEFHPDFQPDPDLGDVVIQEHWLHDGFSNTDLDFQLKIRGLDHLVLAGMRANACIEATARRGVELGYHVTLVKDATAALRQEEWAATLEVNALTFAHSIVTTDEVVRQWVAPRGDREGADA